jgi:hypothetical protein
MNTALVSCTKCKAPLLGGVFNMPGLVPCPACSAPLHVEIFPAMFRRIEKGRDGDAVMEEIEASCFYHPQKKAVLPCESCGRFVCALCDCVLNGQHLCPACLESGRSKGKIKSLENKRVLYDNMAMSLSILALVPPVIYFSWLVAPAAIYVSVRHWNSPSSIVPRTKIRFVVAMTIATLEICGGIALIYAIMHLKHHPAGNPE